MLGCPLHIPTEFKGDGLGKGLARSLEGNKRAADNQSVDEGVVLGDSECIVSFEKGQYTLWEHH